MYSHVVAVCLSGIKQQRSGILVKQHVRVYCFIVMKRLGPENIFCKVVNLRANQVILRNGPLF